MEGTWEDKNGQNCMWNAEVQWRHTLIYRMFISLPVQKDMWPRCLAFMLLKRRNNSLWRLVGLVFCVGFNCNGRQNKVGLEMLDLLSSLNSFNPTSIHANVLTIDYICAVTSQWKAMGTTCRILTFSGKPYFFFQLSTAPESWWVAAHHKNKTALPPPCCHSPH